MDTTPEYKVGDKVKILSTVYRCHEVGEIHPVTMGNNDTGLLVDGLFYYNSEVAPVKSGFTDEEIAEYLKDLPPDSALATQVGGSHYKKYAIQPTEYAMVNKLDTCQANVVKYVTRFRDKGGVEDLKKAKHYIDMLIEFEEKNT